MSIRSVLRGVGTGVPWPSFITLLLCLALLALTACGEGEDRRRGAAGAGVEEGYATTFTFISGAAHHFMDPQRMSWRHDIRIANCLWEPLVKLAPPENAAASGQTDPWRIVPGVAERWKVSDDGLTYTFHFREDAKWSNGQPVRPTDFIYAWQRAMTPDLAADYAKLMFAIAGAEDFFHFRSDQLGAYLQGAEQSPAAARAAWDEAQAYFDKTVGLSAPDDRTLVVRLAQPVPYFLELVAFATFMPQHRAAVEEYTVFNADTGMLATRSEWTKPGLLVTNGPYVLADWRFKQSTRLELNPHYWDKANVGTPVIVERIVDDPQTALIQYERGEVDWLASIPSMSPMAGTLVRAGRGDVHVFPMAGTYFYNFNNNETFNDGTPNPLADRRVRVALSMAVDRETIVNKITRIGQPVARTFVPPGALEDYQPPVDAGVTFDPQAARELLAGAGYRTPDQPQGKALTGLTLLYNTDGGHENIAQFIKRTWEQELDVVVTLQGVESGVFGERLKSQNFAIARAGWFGDYQDATTFLDKFRTGNGNNDAAYSNPQFDALMAQADQTRDPQRRIALMAQAEALMLADQPIIPILQYADLYLFDPQRVERFYHNSWGNLRLDLLRVKER